MVKKIRDHWLGDQGARDAKTTAVARILGAPDDRGVLNVGGRLGAGHGPQAFRQMLAQFMLGIQDSISQVDLRYGIDISLGTSIESAHDALRSEVAKTLKAEMVPIVIGGGHDFGYPHLAGASDALRGKVALINVDAHLDVRPPGSNGITSGSPFFLALEEGVVKPQNFVEFGIQEHCNDASYYEYARKKGVEILMLEEVRANGDPTEGLEKLIAKFARKGLKTVVSFDVDAFQMAYAPGVSAPQSDGFRAEDFLGMARLCGESASVATIGFFELAPPLDENQKTTRLVATAAHRFLSGLARRPIGKTSLRSRVGVSRLLSRRRK